MLPGLIATELGLLAIATASGWGGQKLRAMLDVVKSLPLFMRERRVVQATRVAPAAEIARHMTAELSSDYLGPASRNPLLRIALVSYWRVVRALLGAR